MSHHTWPEMTSCGPLSLDTVMVMGVEIGLGIWQLRRPTPTLPQNLLCVSCTLRHRQMLKKMGRVKL